MAGMIMRMIFGVFGRVAFPAMVMVVVVRMCVSMIVGMLVLVSRGVDSRWWRPK